VNNAAPSLPGFSMPRRGVQKSRSAGRGIRASKIRLAQALGVRAVEPRDTIRRERNCVRVMRHVDTFTGRSSPEQMPLPRAHGVARDRRRTGSASAPSTVQNHRCCPGPFSGNHVLPRSTSSFSCDAVVIAGVFASIASTLKVSNGVRRADWSRSFRWPSAVAAPDSRALTAAGCAVARRGSSR